ncbi:MAG: hypothetical protein C4576_30100 [Desulfobacteraceae bacterium]|nr:MAG: hypothetical protein C4576_30100 [Desulfobacteraceae bacterium]
MKLMYKSRDHPGESQGYYVHAAGLRVSSYETTTAGAPAAFSSAGAVQAKLEGGAPFHLLVPLSALTLWKRFSSARKLI